MEDDTIKEVDEIVKGFDKEENKNVTGISDNPLDTMNKKMAEFFTARIDSVASTENLTSKVKEALEIQVPILTFDQLLKLFNALKQSTSIASESILKLLQPVNGTPNKLIDNLVNQNSENGDKGKKFFDDLSKDEMQTVNEMFNVLKQLVSTVKEDNIT